MNIGSKSLKKLVYRVHKSLIARDTLGVSLTDIKMCNDVKAYITLLYEYRGFVKHGDRLYWM